MSVQTPAYLKARYESGDIPTQTDYEDLIDSMGSVGTDTGQWVKGVFYVSTDAAILDHSNTGQVGGFAWAVDQYGANPLTIEFPADTTYSLVNNNLIVPAGVNLRFQPNAVVDVGTGVTLTINGSIEAGPRQIFSGDGTVVVTDAKVPEFLPQWWGVTGDGTTDDSAAMQKCATATAGRPVSFQKGTYILDAITGVYGRWSMVHDAVLKHGAAGSDHMVSVSGDFTMSGGAVDGNKDNQTGRYYTFKCEGNFNFSISGVAFSETVSGAVWGHDLGDGSFSIFDCRFTGMAEHGGALGETSLAVYVNGDNQGAVLSLCHNVVIADPIDTGAEYQPAGFEVFSSYTEIARVDISNNYFELCGQRQAGNLIGAIDLYGQTDSAIICGNRLVNCGGSVIKVKNCDNVVISNNAIDGVLSSDEAHGIYLSSYDIALGAPPRTCYRWVVSGNVIRDFNPASGGSCIYIVGDTTEKGDSIIVANNVLDTFDEVGIRVYGISSCEIANNIIANGTGTTFSEAGILISNSTLNVTVSGGVFKNLDSYAILAQTSCPDLSLKVDGVTFIDNAYQCIYAKNIKELDIRNCAFRGTQPFHAETIDTLWAYGNVGDTGTPSITVTTHWHKNNSWDMLSFEETHDFGSVNTGRAIAANLAATGVLLGDRVQVSCSTDVSDLIPYAHVTATNVIEYGFLNLTGGTVDCPETTFYFSVDQR